MKRIITLVIGLVIFGSLIGFFVMTVIVQKGPENFKECEQRNYPVMESHPRKCQAPNGMTFTEEL